LRQTIFILAALVLIAIAAWKLCYLPGPIPMLPPNLTADWTHQVYSLDINEAARLVPPPYPPPRLNYMRTVPGMPQVYAGVVGQLAYQLPGRMTSPKVLPVSGTLRTALCWAGANHLVDLDVPKNLMSVPVDGDWVVNNSLSADQRNQALQSILRCATGKNLTIEKKMLERDVIVVRGKWSFTPLQEQPSGQMIWLQFYTDSRDPPNAEYGAGDLESALNRLEETLARKVFDEVTQRPTTVVPVVKYTSANRAIDNDQALVQLLDNLTMQTSLEFVRTRRVIPIWFIKESGGNK